MAAEPADLSQPFASPDYEDHFVLSGAESIADIDNFVERLALRQPRWLTGLSMGIAKRNKLEAAVAAVIDRIDTAIPDRFVNHVRRRHAHHALSHLVHRERRRQGRGPYRGRATDSLVRPLLVGPGDAAPHALPPTNAPQRRRAGLDHERSALIFPETRRGRVRPAARPAVHIDTGPRTRNPPTRRAIGPLEALRPEYRRQAQR